MIMQSYNYIHMNSEPFLHQCNAHVHIHEPIIPITALKSLLYHSRMSIAYAFATYTLLYHVSSTGIRIHMKSLRADRGAPST